MNLDPTAILNAVQTHALASGYFDRVNGHEPKAAPGNGLSAAVWVDDLVPVAARSGLATVSALLVVNVRLYSNMTQEPQDAIDPNLLLAATALYSAYSGHFTLGGIATNVDLLGAHGRPMRCQAGYLEQDRRLYRVYTITLPIVVDDVWAEAA